MLARLGDFYTCRYLFTLGQAFSFAPSCVRTSVTDWWKKSLRFGFSLCQFTLMLIFIYACLHVAIDFFSLSSTSSNYEISANERKTQNLWIMMQDLDCAIDNEPMRTWTWISEKGEFRSLKTFLAWDTFFSRKTLLREINLINYWWHKLRSDYILAKIHVETIDFFWQFNAFYNLDQYSIVETRTHIEYPIGRLLTHNAKLLTLIQIPYDLSAAAAEKLVINNNYMKEKKARKRKLEIGCFGFKYTERSLFMQNNHRY